MSRSQRATNAQRTHSLDVPRALGMAAFVADLCRTPDAELDCVPEYAGIVCEHLAMETTEPSKRGEFDDHETLIGKCSACGAPVVGTIYDAYPAETIVHAVSADEIAREARRAS